MRWRVVVGIPRLITDIKLPLRKWEEAALSGERKTKIGAGGMRRLCVADSLGRASTHGALAVSLGNFRDELAGAPGRYRGTGLSSNKICETNRSRGQKSAEVSGKSAGSRRGGIA
jgi:hypothetical protein